MSDALDEYDTAKQHEQAVRKRIDDTAANLEKIASVLRKDPKRLSRPNPNFAETRADGALMIDEPVTIDLPTLLPSHSELHRLVVSLEDATRLVTEKKKYLSLTQLKLLRL